MHLKSVSIHANEFPRRDVYPFNIAPLQKTESVVFENPVTCFVGENGTGKSTLLEAMAITCGIHIWKNSEWSRPAHNPYEETFHRYLSVDWSEDRVPGSFFGSDIFRQFAEMLDGWASADQGQLSYFGGRSLTVQSHGQSLMSFFRNRYRLRGLYLLDEPETALSPKSQIELLHLLRQTAANGHVQYIIATHSPILLACPDASIYSFDETPLKRIQYEETEHYRIYKAFMEDRSGYLARTVETREKK
jgi:predicted ATPase